VTQETALKSQESKNKSQIRGSNSSVEVTVMNPKEEESFARDFKYEWERNRGLDVLCESLRGKGYNIKRIIFEPIEEEQHPINLVNPEPHIAQKRRYTVTVVFHDNYEPIIIFYAHFPETVGIKPYQHLEA
jgi:hypothetical protein